ncbi:hypothetical protein HA402_002037 [Bradysia odoriphaga]|nr:hypothetical protein HA402_002037 [Bradysia odoriphaga]
MPAKRQHKVVERPKTRKELRKDKRLQKKANRVHFHKRKKELRVEYRARLKEKNGKGKKHQNDKPKEQDVEEPCEEEDEVNMPDDDEIESDFELSDEEMESKMKGISAKKPKPIEMDRLQQDRQREKQKQKSLEKEMRKQRVRQLKSANEEEDKVIRKLEKQLKIDKTRSDKYVPKMFNDGLEYALELCLPENIQKMYTAAKEAAQSDSDDGFDEDLQIASGLSGKPKNEGKEKIKQSTALTKKAMKEENERKASKRMAKLKKAEGKLFEDLDSDLSGVDSEFEQSAEENEGNDESDDSEGDDFGLTDSADEDSDGENSEFGDSEAEEVDGEQSEDEDGSSDEAPEERPIKKSGKSNFKKQKLEMPVQQSESSGSDNESQDDDLSTDEPGKFVRKPVSGSESESADDWEAETKTTKTWEDIYGRKRDKDGKVIEPETSAKDGKYIPPHVRARLAAEGGDDPKKLEKLNRLKKQLKGWLNRLSEANMYKIVGDIDNLYMQNPRYDMNVTLTSLIFDSLVSNVLAPERMVLEHMLLIAALHGNVGSEVGAHFLQFTIEKFNSMLANLHGYDVEDKQLDNVIFIICHMYTFKLFHHGLIFEILQKLTSELCEKSVECVLLTLKSIGFALRKDDPMALKDLIATLQTKTNEASDELKNNARLKYMLDVLLAVKNNNVNKIPQYDPSLAEHLRKILKTLLVNGKYVTSLNITLDDLLKADQRGKWWVVGSAWSGNVDDIGVAKSVKTGKKEQMKFSEQMLELAKKQRMNTDDRRNVFCVLMTAEDYIEAFEKLHQLAIKDHRVIVTVIIHCCLSEKIFNPYYAVLSQKFCDVDRKYQLAIQFAVWDRIKDINSHTNIQIKNLAQFLIYLIEHGGQPLSVLKVVEFAELDKPTLRLVRQTVLGLLLNNEDTCKQVFHRIAPSVKLKSFKESIRLFMQHFLLKGGRKSGVTEDKMELLKKRIDIADRALQTVDSLVQF